MKRNILTTLAALLLTISTWAQIPVYKWVSGDSTGNEYSTSLRSLIGNREKPATWVDEDGNFWLFGGEGYTDTGFGFLNDMWKFSTQLKKWTLVNGGFSINQKASPLENSLRFDGFNDAFEIDSLREYTSDFSWAAWIKTTSDEYVNVISFGISESNCCGPDNGSEMDLLIGNGSVHFTNTTIGWISDWGTQVNDGNWHHVAITVKVNDPNGNEVVSLYVDGIKKGEIAGDFDDKIDDSSESIYTTKIGRGRWSSFDGSIDEVKIWDKALSNLEVAQSMGSKAIDENMIVYFDFDQGNKEGDNLDLTISTYPEIMFTKADWADYTVEANQDVISPSVKLTRADARGLYNAAQEAEFQGNWYDSPSPEGTLWAYGFTGDVSIADYKTWVETNEGYPPNMVGQQMTMYIPDEGRFFDIMFTSWTTGLGGGTPGGGGFSYTRREIDKNVVIGYNFIPNRVSGDHNGRFLNFQDRTNSLLKGSLSEFRVWSTARTDVEIMSNMNQVPNNEPNLVVYYDFSEGVRGADNSNISEIIDQTGNGYNGLPVNMDLMGDSSNYSNSISLMNPLSTVTYPTSDCGIFCTLGIIGSATPGGWAQDTDMVLEDESGFDKDSWILYAYLTEGNLSFRANDNNSLILGSAYGGFYGVGNFESPPITISEEGWYEIHYYAWSNDYWLQSFEPEEYTQISIIGPATPGADWNTDTNLVQDNNDPHVWWYYGMTLTADYLKFREGGSWTNSWGSANFPSGYALPYAGDILATAGTYDIYFNDITKEFGFIENSIDFTSVGIIGTSTPQGNSADTDLVKDPQSPFRYTGVITLKEGDAYFRAEDLDTYNWSSVDFPSGTGVQAGTLIDVLPGRYFVQFNSGTGEYSFQNLGLLSEKVVAGDFDNDGYPDLAVANFYSDNVLLFMNDQAGNLSYSSTASTAAGPYDLAVGDFDNDGNLDVATVNLQGNSVSVLLGDGAGNLAFDNTYSVGNSSAGIGVGQIDGLNGLDIVVTNAGDQTISVLLGVGDGTFGAPTDYATGGSSYGMSLYDLNKDGDLDVSTANYDGSISILEGNGDGSFGSFVNIPTVLGPHIILAADMNQDTNPDLVVSNYNDKSISVLLGDGSMNFVSEEYPISINPDGLAVADFNLDGNLDVSVGRTDLIVLYGDGLGGLSMEESFDNFEVNNVIDVISTDLDLDTRPDLIYSTARGKIGILNNSNLLPTTQNSISLDGIDDYIEVQNLNVYTSNFTIEAWIKTSESGTIFSFTPSDVDWGDYGNFALFVDNEYLALDIWGIGSSWSLASANDNTWHHVAMKVEYDYSGPDERVVVYLDGSIIGDQIISDFSGLMDANNGFVTKLGSGVRFFPQLSVPTGGMKAGAVSNWTEGAFQSSIGARARAASMSDSNNNFWMFGGYGIDDLGTESFLNDLQLFDRETNEWNLVSGSGLGNAPGIYGTPGVSDPGNNPGGRNFASGWTDSNDNLWVFGGYGLDENSNYGHLSDLWRYDPVSSEWTWVSGESGADIPGIYGTQEVPDINNLPGARANYVQWQDSNGGIWIFGGFGQGETIDKGYLNDLWHYNPSDNTWEWVSGATIIDQGGVYGVLGVPDASNSPGGRSGAMGWVDENGIFWLMGGYGFDKQSEPGNLSDLWRYDPVARIWTWMGGADFNGDSGNYGELGVGSTENYPGNRFNGASWTGINGDLYLFGGFAFGFFKDGHYNDLWSYDVETQEWTWLDGENQFDNMALGSAIYGDGWRLMPGARGGALNWIDENQNIYILGGSKTNNINGVINDMWKFNGESEFWTYLGGSVDYDTTSGNFGTKGFGSSTNAPPARWHAAGWYGRDGKLWFYGGLAAGIGTPNYRGDMWNYDPNSGLYTWMSGSSQINVSGSYGTKGVPSVSKFPGARSSAVTWTDKEGMMWIFGGYQQTGKFNDLWKFNPNTTEWTWVSGRSSQNSPGSYGTQGVADPANEIQARRYPSAWMDLEGNMWVFGGDGRNGLLNDLWKYNPETNIWTWMSGTNVPGDPGNYGTIGVPSPDNLPPARMLATSWTDDSGNLWLMGGNGNFYDDLWKYDTKTGYWTCVYEHPGLEPIEIYGELGVGSASNRVPPRYRGSSVTGNDKKFWLYGGIGIGKALNDLWTIEFVPGTPAVYEPHITNQTDFTFSYDEAFSTEFQIEITDELADFNNLLQSQSVAEDTLQIVALQPGTIYNYRVKGQNHLGISDYSDTIQVLTLPETPQFLNTNQKESRVEWLAVPEIFDGYELEVSTDQTFSDSLAFLPGYGMDGIPQTIAKDSTGHNISVALEPGVNYYARIRAHNSSGSSPNSNTLVISTIPSAPVVNAAEDLTETKALLSWSQPEGALFYIVDISTDSLFTDPTAFELEGFPVAVPSLLVPDLTSGETYFVRVQSANDNGSSGEFLDYGTTNFVTVSPAPFLEDPVEIYQTSAIVNWQKVIGADHYEVDVSRDQFQTKLPSLGAAIATDTVLLIEGLAPGEVHQVRARTVNASGTSINSFTLNVLTVPATPTAREASNKSSNSFTANWDAANGAAYYILEVSENAFDSLIVQDTLLSAIPVPISELVENIDYEYRVRAGNESGESPNSNVILARTSNAAQPLAYANINFSETFDKSLTQSEIAITTSGGQGDASVSIKYKGILEAEFSADSVLEKNTDGEYVFVVTPDLLDDVGFEFELSATDGFSTIRSTDNFIYWSFNDVQSDTLPINAFGGSATSWQIFSIPYKLNDNLIETVFNETGALNYKVDWRLVHYQNTGDDQSRYVDAGEGINRIELGKGYWFNALQPVKINIGSGSVNDQIPFSLSLIEGWNQIGNPFNVPISWNSVLTSNGVVGTVETLLVYDSETQSFVEGDVIEPFSGGFVWADQTITIMVSPHDNAAGGRISTNEINSGNLDADEWILGLGMRYQTTEQTLGGIGMHPDASESKDFYDQMALPRFLYYTEMYTKREGYFYPYYAVDVQPYGDERSWNFEVSSNMVSGPAELYWDNSQFQNSFAQLYLLDKRSGRLIDMKKQSKHMLVVGTNEPGFEIYYLRDPNATLQTSQLILGDAFPNPASERTLIPVVLPQESQLEIHIFDASGKKIATIADGIFDAGYHEFEWKIDEQTNVPQGLYIYQLRLHDAAGSTLQKKIIVR